MAEDIDIVDRLGKLCLLVGGYIDGTCGDTLRAASITIQSLRSRVSELEAEREKLASLLRRIDDVTLWEFTPPLGNSFQEEIEEALGIGLNTDTAPQAQVRAEAGASVAPDGWKPTPPAAEAVGGGLRERIAKTLARYAGNSFSSLNERVVANTATFPDDYGAHEQACFRTLADRVLDELQRERGAVAGRDGGPCNCALKGTGPAASDPVTPATAKVQIEHRMGDLVDLLAAFPGLAIDPRAWSQLLVYAAASTASDDQVSTGGCSSRLLQESALPTRLPGKEILGSGVANDSGEYPEAQAQCSNAGAPGKAVPSLLSPASDDLVVEVAKVIEGVMIGHDRPASYWDCECAARAVLSSPPVREMVSVITEAIRLHDIDQQMWMPTPTGQKWRHSASSILSRFQSVGGDGVDASSPTGSQAALRAQKKE